MLMFTLLCIINMSLDFVKAESILNLHYILRPICVNILSYSRAVEIPCPTCPTWSHFIQDKLKIFIYLSLDKYNV